MEGKGEREGVHHPVRVLHHQGEVRHHPYSPRITLAPSLKRHPRVSGGRFLSPSAAKPKKFSCSARGSMIRPRERATLAWSPIRTSIFAILVQKSIKAFSLTFQVHGEAYAKTCPTARPSCLVGFPSSLVTMRNDG